MKKLIAGIGFATVVAVCLMSSTASRAIALDFQKSEERARTIHRTLAKKTEFESKTYNEEYGVTLACVFAQDHYAYCDDLAYVVNMCLEKNNDVYSPYALQTVQACAAQHQGFNKRIVPISGMTVDDEYTFFVVPGGNDLFYLNIPEEWVFFLNLFEDALHSDELIGMSMSQEEVVQYNLLASLIHCGLRIITEMNEADLHVCAYTLQSLDDAALTYNVTEEKTALLDEK